MQVTDVRVRKIAKEGRMKAVVSITLDEEFVVHDIKVIEGDKGLFICRPLAGHCDEQSLVSFDNLNVMHYKFSVQGDGDDRFQRKAG